MMSSDWLTVVGMVLILEAVLPLFMPAQWRSTVSKIAQLRDGQIRFIALGALLAGLVLVML
jgi:uncharacterized protein